MYLYLLHTSYDDVLIHQKNNDIKTTVYKYTYKHTNIQSHNNHNNNNNHFNLMLSKKKFRLGAEVGEMFLCFHFILTKRIEHTKPLNKKVIT